MTVYRLYNDSGQRCGFWIQRRGWGNICAMVLTVGGAESGPLSGGAPVYGNAEVIIRKYDVRSGRVLEDNVVLTDPADKNYTFIAAPSWSRRTHAGSVQETS